MKTLILLSSLVLAASGLAACRDDHAEHNEHGEATHTHDEGDEHPHAHGEEAEHVHDHGDEEAHLPPAAEPDPE